MNEIQKYIMALDENADIDELNKIINQEVDILQTTWSWGEEIPKAIRVKITNIKAFINISDKSLDSVMIYSDYFAKEGFLYNAWTSLKGLQAYIEKLDIENKKPLDPKGKVA